MISSQRLEKAMTFLAETDEEAAELKTDVERQDYRRKHVRAQLIAHGDGAMELRKAQAESSNEYKIATGDWLEAMSNYQKLANKRQTEMLVIEVWRSLNASRRQGAII